MTTNRTQEPARARIATDASVTTETETFGCRIQKWDPYGGAYSFGTAEMESWMLTLLHDTHAAERDNLACWVLTGASDATGLLTATRYRGGPLDETQVHGLVVLDEDGALWTSTDLYTGWSASSQDGFSDLPAGIVGAWPTAGQYA